jgi:hypothetical protein
MFFQCVPFGVKGSAAEVSSLCWIRCVVMISIFLWDHGVLRRFSCVADTCYDTWYGLLYLAIHCCLLFSFFILNLFI